MRLSGIASMPLLSYGRIPTAAAAVKHLLLLLLFNTTPTAAAFQHNARAREHAPDPQARESQSPWTEVWPTQPVLTQPRKHWPLIGGAWGKKDDHPSISARTAPVFPRLYTSSINRAAVGSSHGRRCPYPRAPWRRNPREQQLDPSLMRPPYIPDRRARTESRHARAAARERSRNSRSPC